MFGKPGSKNLNDLIYPIEDKSRVPFLLNPTDNYV
jgi:hypothetical protein